MKFTFTEWKTIRHDLEVAANEYEEMMQDCKVSNDELSMYQIFKRQMQETRRLMKKLDDMEI